MVVWVRMAWNESTYQYDLDEVFKSEGGAWVGITEEQKRNADYSVIPMEVWED
jgi:hypothetical protein